MKELRISLLTRKELDVLALWICGQTAKQSASYLGKSNRTIETHRERIKCKLGVYRSSELINKVSSSAEFVNIMKKGLELMHNATCKDRDIFEPLLFRVKPKELDGCFISVH